MNKEKASLEFRVGIFVLLVIIGVLIFIFSQTHFRWKGYEIGVSFNYIGGLEIGSPVRVSGVKVGEVKKIEILYDVVPKVIVRLKLKPDVKIGKHSRITIRTLGIIGEKYVEITPSSEKTYISPGEIVEGVDPISYERLLNMGQEIIGKLNAVVSDIRKITGEKDVQANIKTILKYSAATVKKADRVFDKIEKLSSNLDATNRKINKVIDENRPKIKKLLEDVDYAVVKGSERFDKLGVKTEKFLDEFSTTAIQFRETAERINKFFAKIEKEGLFARLMEEEKLVDDIKEEIAFLKETTLQFKESAEEFAKLCKSLNLITSGVSEGKGSIGQFLTSDEIYNEVLEFIKDIKAHPWKLFIRRR
ncbi:MCE family protein [bacterium]|nr:MCE family protein [bacterium]